MTAVRWTTGFWADRFDLLPSHRAAQHETGFAGPQEFGAPVPTSASRGLEEGQHAGVNWSDGRLLQMDEAMAWVYALTRDRRWTARWTNGWPHCPHPGPGRVPVHADPVESGQATLGETPPSRALQHGPPVTAASVHHAATGKRLSRCRTQAGRLPGRGLRSAPETLAHYGWNPSNIMAW